MLADLTRRHFLRHCPAALAPMYLASQAEANTVPVHAAGNPLSVVHPPHRGKAERVIFLHMLGAPSTLDLFDYRPELARLDGQECPQSLLKDARFAFIQGTPLMLGPQYAFAQHGESGQWVSDRLPHIAGIADELCFLRTVQTDQFNHGPAELMVHTGDARIGKPSIGSWATWGLGTENDDLPGFIVLMSGGRQPRAGKSLWSAGVLPSVYQGVQCRSKGAPVLNVENPKGVSRQARRDELDVLAELNRASHDRFGDPETLTRIAQYETAYRMQLAAPEAMDVSGETAGTLAMYGAEPGQESFANNCLLARRLAERGVRFIQLYDWGWDSHGASGDEALNKGFKNKCVDIDRAIAGLITDLKQRGLLETTLVVWGGEFGRTPMRENRGGVEMKFVGRDHNPNAFTWFMAGGGVKGGHVHGETDAIGYQALENPRPLRDVHATMLHLLGFDHDRLAFKFQGLDHKLTGVKPAEVIHDIVA